MSNDSRLKKHKVVTKIVSDRPLLSLSAAEYRDAWKSIADYMLSYGVVRRYDPRTGAGVIELEGGYVGETEVGTQFRFLAKSRPRYLAVGVDVDFIQGKKDGAPWAYRLRRHQLTAGNDIHIRPSPRPH